MAKVYPTHRISELLWAWLAATLLSAIPSTVYALLTGGDVSQRLSRTRWCRFSGPRS
jgi:hypothetical protein